MRYTIYNDYDPNDNFTVTATNSTEAAFAALGELGWSVAETPDAGDEDEN